MFLQIEVITDNSMTTKKNRCSTDKRIFAAWRHRHRESQGGKQNRKTNSLDIDDYMEGSSGVETRGKGRFAAIEKRKGNRSVNNPKAKKN